MEYSLFITFSLFACYLLMQLYLSTMQIGYIAAKRFEQPILLSSHDYQKAALYAMTKERITMIGFFIEAVLFFFWFAYGLHALQTLVPSSLTQSVIVINAIILLHTLFQLPLEYVQKQIIDKKMGFSQSSSSLFFKDSLKKIVITFIVVTLLVTIADLIIQSHPLWWFFLFVVLFTLYTIVSLFGVSLFILPFNTLKPLEDGELKTKISHLLHVSGFHNNGIFVMDASKRDTRLNAFFAGSGKAKKVVLYDTLLNKLSDDEILAVLGHELGHFQGKHIYQLLALMGILLASTLAIIGNIPLNFFEHFHLMPTSSNYLALLTLFVLPVVSFWFMPLINFIARRNEFEADHHSKILVSGQALSDALIKLVSENKSFPYTHPLYALFYHTHPLVTERLEHLKN